MRRRPLFPLLTPAALALAALLGCGSSAGVVEGEAAGARPRAIATHVEAPVEEAPAEVTAGGEEIEPPVDPATVPLDPSCLPDTEEAVFGCPIRLYDPSGRAMRAFHESLRRAEAGEGQARLVFYGASHTAADYYAHYIRDTLQSRFGDAGHGFIMPAQPWRSYRHLGMEVESNHREWRALRIRTGHWEEGLYGYAGMAVESDSAEAWGRVQTGQRPISRVELMYLRQPNGGSFELLVDGALHERVMTAAAENGPGYVELSLPERPHTLEVRVHGDGVVRLFGMVLERERPGVVVDNLGINGAMARSQLYWDAALQQEQLRRRAPSLVSLAYGTNESGNTDRPIEPYEENLREVMTRIREAAPQASCLLIGPSDWPVRQSDGSYEPRARTEQVIEVQRRVARDFGCAFFNLLRFGGGPLSMLHWSQTEPHYVGRDLVHFTRPGYLRLAEVLLSAMMEGFEAVPPVVHESGVGAGAEVASGGAPGGEATGEAADEATDVATDEAPSQADAGSGDG